MPGGMSQTLRPLSWRAEQLYPETEIVSRTSDGISRYTYAAYGKRTAQLAGVLDDLGLGREDRVGTVCWNHHRHFETYFGVPTMGAQLHTINPLLPDDHIDYIVGDAEDQILLIDPSFIDKVESAQGDGFASVEQYVIMGDEQPSTSLAPVTDYESWIAEYPPEYDWPVLDEDLPAGLCYTSGTTGRPKGVEYTQQMLWSHTMMSLTSQGIPLDDQDVVMPVVPMFHVNAWGLPFSATAVGATHVYPGPSPNPSDLATLIEDEGVTVTAGVPTVWLGLLEYLEEHPVDLSALETIIVGGSAAPEAMIRAFDEYDVEVLHAWGMTEMTPIGSTAYVKADYVDDEYATKVEKRTKQGLMVPGLEFKVVDDAGNEVEWNGEDFGELWVRGPTVTTEYFGRPAATEEEFDGSWLKTGDVVTVDEDGYLQIVDRAKDVIKSGGEWISSVELENAIMAHDAVSEAAVIGVAHERWQERPVAFVVPTTSPPPDGLSEEIRAVLEDDYPKWWLPDRVEYIEAIPKTATGKFSKKDLRDEYADESLVEGRVPDDAAPE